ncbi:MAG: glycosyltransferase family 2 protein [Flavobacteriales bacterium]
MKLELSEFETQPETTRAYSKIAIIVPAFNEAGSIKDVLEDLNRVNPGHWDIIIVNDHSEDETLKFAQEYSHTIIELPINLGIGGCVQSGLLFAHRNGYDIAVQFDSDGQHVASEIKTLLWAMSESNADVVIGSRFIQSFEGQFKSSFFRRLGIKVIRLATKALTGSSIKDPTSGFRAFNVRAISLFAMNYPVHYPEPESLIKLHKNNLKVHEVSTLMNPRSTGESSIKQKAVFYMFNVLLGMMVTAMRPQKPNSEHAVRSDC